ncbi:MAG: glycosyl hydrolase family 28-related protein, partial [Acidobacteriaceae bacterium]
MSDAPSSLFNRRDVARAALIGGASTLLSATALNAQSTAGAKGLLNAHDFGAAGDGKTDDTAALQRAIDAAAEVSGGVFLPPAVYLTRELHVRAGIALVGIPAWNY